MASFASSESDITESSTDYGLYSDGEKAPRMNVSIAGQEYISSDKYHTRPYTRPKSFEHEVPTPVYSSNQRGQRWRDLEAGTSAELFKNLTYTPVVCNPLDFHQYYTLLPQTLGRRTELLIAVTYYNEDKVLFARTLHSVMTNIQEICNQQHAETWTKGGPAWQKIVVCFLFDGMENADSEVLDTMTAIGLYRRDVLQMAVADSELHGPKETVAHVFEYTTRLCVTPQQQLIKPAHEGPGDWYPMQLMLLFKQKNARKINSHHWLFSGISRVLNPEIIVLLDIGTKPQPKSLLRLWEAFYYDKNLGGASGEIHAYKGRAGLKLLNPLVAAQNFEYKITSILDKPFESVCGYLTVLPGAFSAYRYKAILGRPLAQYIKGDPSVKDKRRTMDILKSNMYLAEDRILCFEVVMKAGHRWRIGYIKQARAETDIPDDVVGFILQRRRWLNGAFAATLYAISHFSMVYRTKHPILRIGALHIQLLYNLFSFLLSWFSMAAFYLGTFIIVDISTTASGARGRMFPFGPATLIVNAVLQFLYIFVLILQFILALGSTPRAKRFIYSISFVFFSIMQIYFLTHVFHISVTVLKDHSSSTDERPSLVKLFFAALGDLTLFASVAAVFGAYAAASFLYLDPWHIITSFPQYLCLSSSYTNILSAYAFSNWHDVSWGTKGRESVEVSLFENDSKRSTSHKTADTSIHSRKQLGRDFEAAMKRALAPYVKPKKDSRIGHENQIKDFRTNLLSIFLFTNLALCVVVGHDDYTKLSFMGDAFTYKVWFLRIWLWATIFYCTIRFVGAIMFILMTYTRYIFKRR